MRKIAANYIFPIASAPIKNGYLLVDDDGTILEVGKLTKETANTEFYNGILCPGFVNAHCHTELSYLKGKFHEGGGMSEFLEQITSLRENCTLEERVRSIKEAFESMYSEGIAAIADISNDTTSFEVKRESPIYTRTFIELFGSDPALAEKIMAKGKENLKKAEEFGLDAGITPHAYYTMSQELLRKSTEAGLSSGFLSCHSDESHQERELLLWGKGALADRYRTKGLPGMPVPGVAGVRLFIENTGKKRIKEKILLVHNIATTKDEILYAQEHIENLFFVLCPLSNIFIHRMLPPIESFMECGATICIGTDSLSSNRQLSMIEELKSIQNNFKGISLNHLLEWSTLNGAKAIGKENFFGSFETGKKPGIVLIDKINWSDFSLMPESRSRRLV